MTGHDNKQIAVAAFEAMGRGDPSLFREAMADDIAWIIEGASAFARVIRGKAAVIGAQSTAGAALFDEPLRLRPERFIAEGDSVAIIVGGEGRTKTGRDFNNRYCFVLKFDEGRIVELREFTDTAFAVEVFGSQPPDLTPGQ